MSDGEAENVKVAVRVRPFISFEYNSDLFVPHLILSLVRDSVIQCHCEVYTRGLSLFLENSNVGWVFLIDKKSFNLFCCYFLPYSYEYIKLIFVYLTSITTSN